MKLVSGSFIKYAILGMCIIYHLVTKAYICCPNKAIQLILKQENLNLSKSTHNIMFNAEFHAGRIHWELGILTALNPHIKGPESRKNSIPIRFLSTFLDFTPD